MSKWTPPRRNVSRIHLAERRDRVGLVNEDEPAHDGVERCRRDEVVDRRVLEGDGGRTHLLRAAPGDRQDARIPIDPHDRSRRPDQRGRQERDVARAAAQVQHAHPGTDSRPPEDPLGERPEEVRLLDEPLTFRSGSSQHVLRRARRVVHESAPRSAARGPGDDRRSPAPSRWMASPSHHRGPTTLSALQGQYRVLPPG
jgi:hypothetical protein